MVRQLGMDKSLAVKSLRESGYSERAIARMLGISRNAVRNHIEGKVSKGTKAPTGEAPTGPSIQKVPKRPPGLRLRRRQAKRHRLGVFASHFGR